MENSSCMKNKIFKGAKWGLENIFLPTLISLVVIFCFQDWLKELKYSTKSKQYVAILISDSKKGFTIPNDFYKGFNYGINNEKNKGYFEDQKGERIQIKCYNELTDDETVDEMKKLVEDPNCVMIVANANSTLTTKNLDELINSKKEVPFIMPIATDDELIEKAKQQNYRGILRILPDNAHQTDCLVNFIEKQVKSDKMDKTKDVIIFKDCDNLKYSENLTNNIVQKLMDKEIDYMEFAIGDCNQKVFNANELMSNACAIIYVGISNNAQSLIYQIRDISIPLILTDGCLDQNVFFALQRYKGESFILSPIKLDEDTKYKESYRIVGKNTYDICQNILSSCEGKRKSVYRYIATQRTKIKIENYEFNADGNNTLGKYTIYPIVGGSAKIE